MWVIIFEDRATRLIFVFTTVPPLPPKCSLRLRRQNYIHRCRSSCHYYFWNYIISRGCTCRSRDPLNLNPLGSKVSSHPRCLLRQPVCVGRIIAVMILCLNAAMPVSGATVSPDGHTLDKTARGCTRKQLMRWFMSKAEFQGESPSAGSICFVPHSPQC